MAALRSAGLRSATLGVVVLSLLLSACGGLHKARGTLLRGEQYVAMGDSYTAAPGLGRVVARDGCYQSDNDYPHLVANETGADLVDKSCVGAQTTGITGSQLTLTRQHVPPQADALGPDTRLVTIGIGANDFGAYRLISAVCPGLAARSDTDDPCTEANRQNRSGGLASLLVRLRPRLAAVLREVHDRAPRALVLLVGYPDVIPAHGTCDLLPLAPGDYPFARSIITGLNQTLAAVARTSDAHYVDVFSATAGHDICSDEPWIAGTKVKGKGAPWHPYAPEQETVAELVVQAVRDAGI